MQTRGVFIGTVMLVGSLGLISSWRLVDPAHGGPAGRAEQPADYDVDLLIVPRPGAPKGTPPEFYFEPTGILVQPGQTVRFRALTPHHTATAYHARHVQQMRVPEGVPSFSSPIIPVGESRNYAFTQPGVYELWCGPREMFGTAMRMMVGEASGPAIEPPTDVGPRGASETAGAVSSDPVLAPERIPQRGRVTWAELNPASKRLPNSVAGR